MRIGTASEFSSLQYKQMQLQSRLDNVLAQMSGLKIQYGYQGTTIFNKTLALDYNTTTLTQSKELATNAETFTRHTDTALSELVKSMTDFKTKLIQGANDIHSETSRLAIAQDLRSIRSHFLSIANTSIGGQYIFSGTATGTMPFGEDGLYRGNSGLLQALIGSNNALTYNITGSELFYGSDNDTNRIITTNVPKFNQSQLHPEIMDPSHPTGQGLEVYITAEDTLRDLVGDSDALTDNTPPEVFYITGRKPDGTAFKAKFEMEVAYTDKNQAATVQDLLDRIGQEFGNTQTTKVVDVTLNKWGQIEIKDLTAGRSNIEFYMVSSSYQDPNNPDGVGVADIDALLSSGVKVNTYIQSPYLGTFSNSDIASVQDYYDHRINTIPTTFRTKNNELAKSTTLLSDIFPEGVDSLDFGGTGGNTDLDVTGNAVNGTFNITATSTLQDLMDFIQNLYGANAGGDVRVELANGQLTIVDNNVSQRNPPDRDSKDLPYDGISALSVTISARDANGNAINAFRNDYSVEYERVGFSRNGATLTSNVSQVVRSTNEYATMATKLSEVAGTSLDGHTYNFEVKDVNGIEVKGRIVFDNAGSYMVIDSPATGNGGVQIAGIQIPILNPNGNPPQVAGDLTPADEVTYQQLADVLGIVMNLSNSNPGDLAAITNNGAGGANFNDPDVKLAYETLIGNSKNFVGINLNIDGELELKDLSRSPTRMEFMLYDSESSNFELDPNTGRVNTTGHPALTFQANNALTADDPHVNFFRKIDEILEAMEKGIYRPGGAEEYNSSMRNAGIQNAILAFDHLADHVNKVHTKNGAQGQAFEYSIERAEMLLLQTKTLRSETIDADIASVYLDFNTMVMNYQAMLSTVGRVSQLTLINYI
ncbi:MAG: flagellar hook-associated protein FlgL [Helicobacter sp.]|nr:flagellar hook-associated protein FlgL [Helicobacter sp.]